MDDGYKIINSRLSRKITRDGVTVDVQIYRGENDPVWILEVIDQEAGSTVWEETFQTEQDALNGKRCSEATFWSWARGVMVLILV